MSPIESNSSPENKQGPPWSNDTVSVDSAKKYVTTLIEKVRRSSKPKVEEPLSKKACVFRFSIIFMVLLLVTFCANSYFVKIEENHDTEFEK